MKKKIYTTELQGGRVERKVCVIGCDIDELPDAVGEVINEVYNYNIIHEAGKVVVWGEYVYEKNKEN